MHPVTLKAQVDVMGAFTEIVKLMKQNCSDQWTRVEIALRHELAKCTRERRIDKWTTLCHNVERELNESIKLPHVRINFLLLQVRLIRKWLQGRSQQIRQLR